MIIQQASSPPDRDECLAIRKDVFFGEQNVAVACQFDSHDQSSTLYLVRVDDKPVATGRIRLDGSRVRLEWIATRKEYRCQGIGSALVTYMKDEALRRYPECTPIMQALCVAIPFYEKLGWHVTSEKYLLEGREHKLMAFSE